MQQVVQIEYFIAICKVERNEVELDWNWNLRPCKKEGNVTYHVIKEKLGLSPFLHGY